MQNNTDLSRRLRGNILLLLAAAIWGGAFVAQSVGNDIGSFTFNGARSLVGVIALLPVIFILDRRRPPEERKPWPWIPGLICGALVTIATTFQQFGLNYTSAGKAGFVTALYIVLVPIVELAIAHIRRKRVQGGTEHGGVVRAVQTAVSLVIAVSGMYLLCIESGEGGVNRGDMLVFVCALVFTFHIVTVDEVAARVDCLKLCCLQFLVCGAVCMLGAFIFESPSPAALIGAWKPLLYAGVLSCSVAYTLQMVGQRDSDPTVAALLMSLESVFAALSGWLILHEHLSARELVGCVMMMSAIVLVQIPLKRKKL